MYLLGATRGEFNSPTESAPEVSDGLQLLPSKDLSLHVTPPVKKLQGVILEKAIGSPDPESPDASQLGLVFAKSL